MQHRRIAFPAALLLALLLCVQTLQVSSHAHADHSAAHDCLQHQVDASYAAHTTHGADPVIWLEAAVCVPVSAQFTGLAHLGHDARGPPTLSC